MEWYLLHQILKYLRLTMFLDRLLYPPEDD